MNEINITIRNKPLSREDKLNRLYNLAYTVQDLDGTFALYMDFIDTDECLKDIPSVDIVNMWSRARRSLATDKEIHLIYGQE